MKFALIVLACVLVPPMILGAVHRAPPSTVPTAPSHPLTIVQQIAADKAAASLVAEVEAANIKGAFNRALRDVGSETQAHQAISMVKYYCFEQDAPHWDYMHGSRAKGPIDCAHHYATKEPAVEI